MHVVRAHTDSGIVHSEGSVDPLRDIATIETELIYADLEQAERRLDRVVRQAPPSGDKHAIAEAAWLEQVIDALQAGQAGPHRAGAGRGARRPGRCSAR